MEKMCIKTDKKLDGLKLNFRYSIDILEEQKIYYTLSANNKKCKFKNV